MQRVRAFLSNPSQAFDRQPLSTSGRSNRLRTAAMIAAIALGSMASPALAERQPTTKLVRCGDESCLQISGYRADPAAIVSLNGQAVTAQGAQNWRVRLPLETVRQWSAPQALTIEVSLLDPATEQETSSSANLPIGLLGDISDIAFLEVRAP